MTYLEFKNKYLGKIVDYDGSFGPQCWDLAEQYITECLGLPESIIGGCGLVNNLLKEPYLSKMKEYFDVIPLDKKKQGDIEVFDWGHIAIMDHWNGSQFVNYYLTQNSGTAENPIGGVYVGAIEDNPRCMAFRKKEYADMSNLKKEIETLTKENKELKDKIKQSIRLIEQYLDKDLSLLDINKLLEILRSSVE